MPRVEPWLSEMLTADFNGDGHEDILVVSANHSLRVLLANGTGPFAAPKTTSITASTSVTGIGDVNGDGRVDVVISNPAPNRVTPMLGNGDGTFTAGTSFTPNVPMAGRVVVADFNNDSLADVAVGSWNTNAFAVHFGNGAGEFSSGTQTSGAPALVKAADLNGDRMADLVAGDGSVNRVYISNGNGTFAALGTMSQGEVVFGDFNHDTKTDLAVAAGGDHQWFVEVLLNNGDATFQAAVRYVAGYAASSIDAADLDRDGNVDLLAAGTQGSAVTVLRGNADGTFDAPEFFLTGIAPWKIVVGDFDRDGAEDFVTAASDSRVPFSFVRGKGDGTFQTYRSFHVNPAVPVIWPGLHTRRPVIGDMNEDGKEDVVVIRKNPDPAAETYELAVLLNDGSGTLAAPIPTDTQSTAWDRTPTFDLGDLNGDGWLDAVVVSTPGGSGGLAVSMLGNGDGTFDPPAEFPVWTFGIPKLADYDGDGNLDVLIPGSDYVTVNPGNGDGTFRSSIRSMVDARAMLYADLNGDGKLDYVSTSALAITAAVNDGTGRFTAMTVTSEGVEGAALADFDGDGKADLLCNTPAGTQMRFGNGDGTFGAPVYSILTPAPNQPFLTPATTADYDGDGKIDVALGTAVYLNDGHGGFRSRSRFRALAGELAVADLDGSGSPDLVYTIFSADDVAVLLTRTTPDPTATTSLALAASRSAVQYAEEVTFEATVTGGVVSLTGAVVFSDGDRNIAVIDVDGEGKALLTTGFPVGSRTITARYTGDEYYQESSATAGLTVTKATSDILLAGQPDPAPAGAGVQISAILAAPRAYGLAYPTGTITIREGATALGSPIDPFQGGVVIVNTLSVGSHVITADYPGDENYEAATASYTQEIIKGTPTLTFEVPQTGSGIVVGSPITLRAKINAGATGTVAFYVGQALVGTAPISNGVAETQTTFSTWGLHMLKLVYSGDATWNAAELSPSLVVRIGPWGTPLQLIVTGYGGGANATWSLVQGAVTYKLWRKTTLGENWTVYGTSSGTVFGKGVAMPANTTWMFAVSAVDANGNESPLSTPDLATTFSFTDTTLAQRVTRIRAQHFNELRTAIGYVRAFAGLTPFAYTNTVAPGQRIRKADLTEMRTALLQARTAIGLAMSFTDNPPSRVRALHIMELRAGVE